MAGGEGKAGESMTGLWIAVPQGEGKIARCPYFNIPEKTNGRLGGEGRMEKCYSAFGEVVVVETVDMQYLYFV